jgi:hypothetical protein
VQNQVGILAYCNLPRGPDCRLAFRPIAATKSPSVDSSAGVRLIAGEDDVDAPDPVGCYGPPLRARDQSNSLALSLLPLSQPDPWAATVLVDKLYAGGFKSGPYLGPCHIPTA